MENYIVDMDNSGFSLEEFEDIKRCLETLLSIRSGTQPLDRDLGINLDDILDYPTNIAMNMITLEIMDKVSIYEPRVEVEYIDFEVKDGKLVPHIHFLKAGE